MRYTAREMEFMGGSTKVLVCNDRAASALTSLSNWLVLNNKVNFDSREPKFTVAKFMEMHISRKILNWHKINVLPTPEIHQIVQEYFDITERLRTGIKVNPVAGTAKFEDSREYDFFRILGVPLLHAPAFNEQVFPSLKEQLEPGQIGILYLNEEFNTICKHNGIVYMLVEDEALHKKNPFASWKTMVDEKEIFVAGDFSSTRAHINQKVYKCSKCLEEFCTEINYERHLEAHVPTSKAALNRSWNKDVLAKYWDQISDEDACSILFDGDQTVEKSHGSPIKPIFENWILGPEFLVTPPEVRDALKQLKQLKRFMEGDRQKPSSDVLLAVLEVGSEGTIFSTNLPEGGFSFVEAGKSQNTTRTMLTYFSLRVEEVLAKKWYTEKTVQANLVMEELLAQYTDPSQELASASIENVEDLEGKDIASIVSETSTSSHVSGDVVHTEEKDEERKLLPADIAHLPELLGEEYFPNFVSRKTLVRLFTLFNKDVVTALTRTGRKIAKRLLNYILKAHKAGHCWNGEWNILDIRVRGDGATLIIDKMPVNATKDGIVADLQKFIVLLCPYYKIEGIKGPAYFDEFHSDVMSLPELKSEKFEIFQKFLADHMAFLPPASTSNLLERLFKLCDDVRRQNGHFTYHPLQRLDCLGWTKIGDIMPYHKVFHYDKTIVEPYKDNYWDLLRFVRNFSNHGLQFTQIDGVQSIEDPVILDIMVAYDLGKFITKLVLHVLYVFEKPKRLVSTWNAYKTSDDATEEIDEDGTEENEGI
ncbi:hypothetical protein SETIT_5G417500v2 [Setaria italica]|uniref:C2H2-type domain-containing protein n=2 Tax=Setaria italica TaxID=4555 RepID=A0A368REI9_SETIT|nr:uncharacterized protein LOC101784064 isoform X1 [Setaria italica]XP_022682704.1 uncharacterized protein LOC101784064 isoform X1 [Setaria italica]XP_022682705.1 uncharacterized protein LOC101784064 isoform X1 [Setaria italica]RCV28615.1 hypothetical protein SETIT_5G417500v2 [Setaria italica]